MYTSTAYPSNPSPPTTPPQPAEASSSISNVAVYSENVGPIAYARSRPRCPTSVEHSFPTSTPSLAFEHSPMYSTFLFSRAQPEITSSAVGNGGVGGGAGVLFPSPPPMKHAAVKIDVATSPRRKTTRRCFTSRSAPCCLSPIPQQHSGP